MGFIESVLFRKDLGHHIAAQLLHHFFEVDGLVLAGGVENPRRTFPGENNMTFVDGFRGLKYIGYQGYCSFECGCANSDREAAFKQTISFLRSQWDEA